MFRNLCLFVFIGYCDCRYESLAGTNDFNLRVYRMFFESLVREIGFCH